MQDESARLRQLPRASDAASRPDARAAPRATSRSSAPRSAGGAGSVSSVSSAWVEGLSKETTRKRQTMLVDACGRWTCATARSATTKTARASRARQSDVMTATLLSEPDDGKHRLPAVRRPLIRERSSMPFSLAPVTVLRRQPEAADRVALGVKLDEDCRLGPCDPRVVSGLDRDDLRRHDLECTAVPVPPLHTTAGEEADVRVHAVLRADNGSDVRGPAEARRVDDPLHPAVGGAHDVELDARDHAVLCASNGRRQRVPRPTQRPPARGRSRTRPGRSSRALHPRLPGRTSTDRRHAPAQDPGERLGAEPEPDQLDALVEVLAVRADPGALDLEDADAPNVEPPPRAAGHRVADDEAERPLRHRDARRFQNDVHGPDVVTPLAIHALEHRPERRAPGMLAVEEVVVGRLLGEKREQRVQIPPVERRRELLGNVHARPSCAEPSATALRSASPWTRLPSATARSGRGRARPTRQKRAWRSTRRRARCSWSSPRSRRRSRRRERQNQVGARAPRWPAWRRARARPRTDGCGKRPATPSRHEI